MHLPLQNYTFRVQLDGVPTPSLEAKLDLATYAALVSAKQAVTLQLQPINGAPKAPGAKLRLSLVFAMGQGDIAPDAVSEASLASGLTSEASASEQDLKGASEQPLLQRQPDAQALTAWDCRLCRH